MYEIVEKRILNESVTEIKVLAPLVAAHAKAGQFVILRPDEESERIPLTVAGYDRTRGTVTVIFQTVGATTLRLSRLNVGDAVRDFVGPLGNPTDLDGISEICIVGGGVGCAIALPVARAFHELGCRVKCIIGFRSRELVILEDEFREVSDELTVVTDDGSYGERGNVCIPLRKYLEGGARPDRVMAIGPLVMMKYASLCASEFGIPSVVSMNPVMIDGTGMCGGCRITLKGADGKRTTRFACVDGPEFDGAAVDFDEAMSRSGAYRELERHAYERECNLFRGVCDDE